MATVNVTQEKAWNSPSAPISFHFTGNTFNHRPVFNGITHKHRGGNHHDAGQRFYWSPEKKSWYTESRESACEAARQLREAGVEVNGCGV